ncbi:hypothetical protein U1Q18_025757 [Sarracenia purpurea var. burkii]
MLSCEGRLSAREGVDEVEKTDAGAVKVVAPGEIQESQAESGGESREEDSEYDSEGNGPESDPGYKTTDLEKGSVTSKVLAPVLSPESSEQEIRSEVSREKARILPKDDLQVNDSILVGLYGKGG